MSKKTKKEELHKIEELEAQLKRALADYANLQRRIDEDKNQIAGHIKSVFLIKFLPILDTLEAAQKEAGLDGAKGILQGVDLAVREFKKLFKEEGVEEVDTSGEFNPNHHEAIEVVESQSGSGASFDNRVVQVLEKGYRLDNKILRAAKVKVEKKKAGK
ncbi:MAG: nucleotide exchange factor GrpE [bacterium]|nr:nucleotide exchange factor GrpE [bacterium]